MITPTLVRFLEAYVGTVAIETPALVIGLDRRCPLADRIANGVWLSAATLPVVWFVLPALFRTRVSFLVAAEILAAGAEVGLFWAGRRVAGADPRVSWRRDALAIVGANLLSFVIGLWLF